eukprot:Em0021g562a
MNNVKAIKKLSETELRLGLDTKKSWHEMYEGSAYIFVGGLDFDLTEGDVLSVFSQYGEIININLVRNKKTGKGKGFCFIGYEDQRSTILAVDNLNGIKLCGRTLRVDHVKEYRRPKDEQGNDIVEKGCAPRTPTQSPSPSPPLSPSEKMAPSKKRKKKHAEKREKKD